MSEGDRPKSGLSLASSTATISSVSMGTKPHVARPIRKVHTFGKRANSIKRDPNSPVIMRGWLYKQDSSGLKLWKRRWFVLSNYCLFYYRDSREEMVLGSILLPSYEIRTAFSKEKKNRRFVFKAEHPGMRTYYFSADTQLDMNSWIRAMNQSAAAECNCGNLNQGGLHSQSVSAHTSFEDIRLPQGDCAKSTESLEVAHLSEIQEARASSSESLHLPDIQTGSPCLKRASLSSSLNGSYCREKKEQPELSSLSSQTHGCPSPISCTKFSARPRTPLPSSSESPPPSSPSQISQPSPVFSLRSSRAYSLPVAPAGSPKLPQAHLPNMHDAHRSPHDAHRSPPRSVVAQAASCDDLSIMSSPRTLHANIPMGRVDIAPNKGLPNNPYAVASSAHKGHSLTPADRYDVFPTSEDSYTRRYIQSPHLHRVRPVGEDGLVPSVGRPQQNRFTDRGYFSPSVGPSRALVMSRLHGRLITPHSASSSYLHLPPLPPLSTRPTPGKRTSIGITGRNALRERSSHSPGRQQFESDTDALLTKLCGQDKILRGLEEETGQLRIEKERLEKALEVTHLRLEEFKGQDATMEKICYQQRQLQDELVHIRARLCDLALDSERVWEDYTALENDVQMLKGSLEHIRTSGHPQDQAAAQQDLWRIHDILAGLRCSPANYRTLENRRSGASPSSPPPLDSHLGANHHSLLPCTETEESTPSYGPETGKPARMGSKPQDGPGSANWKQSPPTSSRGQLGASQHVDGLKGSPNHPSIEPPESEKGKVGRGADSVRPGSTLPFLQELKSLIRSIPFSFSKEQSCEVASSETTVPRRSRMSAQEQLDRMQRHQQAKRKSEAAQPTPLGHWRDSLKHGSSRPLPIAPPESSPKEGMQIGEVKPPRCPPTPEWERQRVIQLSYALATEASQRGKLLTGRTSSRSSLDDLLASEDGLNHHYFPGDGTCIKLDSSSTTAGHNQTITQSPSCSTDSKVANQVPASAQATKAMFSASEASDWSLPCPCEESWLPSKPKTPQPTSHLLDPAREESFLLGDPHWEEPLPQPTNWNACFCRTANWVLPPVWDLEMWAADQKLVGNPSLNNGRCIHWRGEPQQVAAYFGEMAQPVKVTLIKSSF
ncbi:pleckstrin homology domain-containing family A member 4 isoform X1 [Pantherophis guttatus]|uniref:Pleckstrin homology domain-containing family A member 4 isoform X1 n=1 Tax=Pantherophis guttatus TaxID=94885 RepID=A0A6P9CJ12_PANGU|nr:pleckstrin homology domain-containing family A member 4 isoform X1 [Pantherophis guttatus]XP_034279137.1 pleckstrin homology domain-containing family A member 4 isoform X1 [Pantherophis guttatus]XP_034279138.1 pleckstrin homology domain-containing family A member 4 isoform X1 [Pantherophis guttatus]